MQYYINTDYLNSFSDPVLLLIKLYKHENKLGFRNVFDMQDPISRLSFYLVRVTMRVVEMITWLHIQLACLNGLSLFVIRIFIFFSLFIIIVSRALCKIDHSHHVAVSPVASMNLINYDWWVRQGGIYLATCMLFS